MWEQQIKFSYYRAHKLCVELLAEFTYRVLVGICVAEDLQAGRRTDTKNKNKSVTDADGFILVKCKPKYTGGYAKIDVAATKGSKRKE